MEQYDLIYITAANSKEAKEIATALVEDRLVACVNIIDNVTSIYRWSGELKHENEVIMIAQTIRPNVNSVIERVKKMHSYEVPEILSVPITTGNPEFLNWVYESTV